jgi:serine/threonine-protein kinase
MSTSPQRLGKYGLSERLGYGGMAEVWKAFDPQLQRYVAIKLLHANLRDDPNFATRFQREAQLIASLHHPNIVQVHDFQMNAPSGPEDKTPTAYMVMDYVEGQTLATYIHATSAQGHVPEPADLLRLFTSICVAVDYAHQHGMIHRDIKPANILLDARNTVYNPMGEPILTDFGVAKLMGISVTGLSGAQVGTPLYISPEQAKGHAGNELSDLYSLGVILYELVTGVTPFRGDNAQDVLTQQISAVPPSPMQLNSKIPPALSLVIMRSLSKDPGARFPSASSLAAALAEALRLPVPENLGVPSYPQDAISGPTIVGTPVLSPAITPNFQTEARPNTGGITPPLQQPLTPRPLTTPIAVPPQTQPAAPPLVVAPAPKQRRRSLYLLLIPLLLLVLIGSGLGYWFLARPSLNTAPVSPIVGQAFFVSSNQLAVGSAQGIADELRIDLQNIPAPQAGKSYYLWLLGDRIIPAKTADLLGKAPITVPLLLTNKLPVQNGSIHYLYPGDGSHNNLLSVGSRLLITEDDANATPSTPPTNRTTWKYYAELPQKLIPLDPVGFSALIHIRHLFYNESDIKILGLYGGLDVWFLRNTESILEWSTAARDDWNGANTTDGQLSQIRDQFIRMLDYLDGSSNVHIDVPPGTPVLVDQTAAKVAMLTVDPKVQNANLDKNPIGYVDHTQFHVNQISQATDITRGQRQAAAHIIQAIKNAAVNLQNARQDIKQLFNLTNDQLRQPAAGTTLDSISQELTYALIGQPDPVTNQIHDGILQMHYYIQQLAAFTVTSVVPNKL